MTLRKQIAAERLDAFTKFVKGHPYEFISAEAIRKEYNVSSSTIADMWKKIPDILGGSYESVRGSGTKWYPPLTPPIKVELPPSIKTELKNAEGYSDPTVAKAIASVTVKKPAPGQVWIHVSQRSMQYIYILYAFEDHTLALQLNKLTEDAPMDFAYPISLKGSGEDYYVNLSMLTTRISKYTTDFVEDLGDKVYMDIQQGISEMLRARSGLVVASAASEANELRKELEAEKKSHKEVVDKYMDLRKSVEEHRVSSDMAIKEYTEMYNKIKDLNKEIEILKDNLKDRNHTIESLTLELDNRPKTNRSDELRIKLLEAQLKVYEEVFA